MAHWRLIALAAAILAAGGLSTALANDTGSVRVRVMDGFRAVDGATVELVQDGEVKYSGETQKEADDEPAPRKTFEDVAPGTYTIRVRYQGREEDEEYTVTVEADKRSSEVVYLESSSAGGYGGVSMQLNPQPGYVVTLNEGVNHDAFIKRTGLPSDTHAFHTVGFNGRPRYALQTNMPGDMWRMWSEQYCNGNSGVESCEEDHCDEWLFPAFKGPLGPKAETGAAGAAEAAAWRRIVELASMAVNQGAPDIGSLKGGIELGEGGLVGESQVSLVPKDPPVETAVNDDKSDDLAWDSGGYVRVPLDEAGRFRVPIVWGGSWQGKLQAHLDWSQIGYGDGATGTGTGQAKTGTGRIGGPSEVTGVVGHPFTLVAGFGWESREFEPPQSDSQDFVDPQQYRFSVGFRF